MKGSDASIIEEKVLPIKLFSGAWRQLFIIAFQG